MKKQVLGLVSIFALFASSSAMATDTYEATATWTGQITLEDLVPRFCVVRAESEGTLKPVSDLPGIALRGNAYRGLSGTGLAGSGNKGSVKVNSGRLEAHLTVTNPRLTKNGANYDGATYSYAGFNRFPGWDYTNFELKAPAVTAVDLESDGTEEEHHVWFYSRRSGATAQPGDAAPHGEVFQEGDYIGSVTVTCEPGSVVDDDEDSGDTVQSAGGAGQQDVAQQ